MIFAIDFIYDINKVEKIKKLVYKNYNKFFIIRGLNQKLFKPKSVYYFNTVAIRKNNRIKYKEKTFINVIHIQK